MPLFRLCLIEADLLFDNAEGLPFVDIDAAALDAIRQIRSMVSVEILEGGKVDLDRAIEIVGDGGISRRVQFAEAISVSI